MSVFRTAVTRMVPWSGSTVGIYFLAALIEIKVLALLVSGLELSFSLPYPCVHVLFPWHMLSLPLSLSVSLLRKRRIGVYPYDLISP